MLNKCTILTTRQSRWKETSQRYIANMLINNVQLQDDVVGGNYAVEPTTDFLLNERGRIRKIEAPAIRDRNVQKVLTMNVLLPSIRPYLIYDNYASLEGRGTSFARKRFQTMLRRYIAKNGTDGYILLLDISKYFENIDHEVLKQRIAPKVAHESEEIKSLINYIIDKSSHTDKGINLGSEAPQIFAVDYLTPMDNYIKIVKGIKYYGRYMDDAFVIAKTKKELLALQKDIEDILASLHLNLNKKKTHIVKLSHGFTFLQVKYNILPTGRILSRMTRKKIVRERRRLKAFKRLVDKGVMSQEEVENCYQSWKGSELKNHNSCYNTMKNMDKLFHTLFPDKIERTKQKRSELTRQINKEAQREDLLHCLTLNNYIYGREENYK